MLSDKSHRLKIAGSITETAASRPPVHSVTDADMIIESQSISVWTEHAILPSFLLRTFGFKSLVHFLVVIVDEVGTKP